MVLVLAIGDLHIPYRSHDLPAKFKKLLVPGKIQQILVTGNICDRETYEYLKSIAPDVRAVKGDWDDAATFPPSIVLQQGPLRIGLIHGHQAVPLGDNEALSALARTMDVDVLVSGGTHKFEAFELNNKYFINPGSATGAYAATSSFSAVPPEAGESSPQPPQPTPSFVLLDIQGYVIVNYVYTLAEGSQVKVEKLEVRLQPERISDGQ